MSLSVSQNFTTTMVSAIILIHILTVANLATIHSKRVTLQKRDMALVRSMRSGILGHTFRRESYSNILIAYTNNL